ncbi:sugar phosphate isomerase/epimerase [Paenibacillus sp. P22]|nr:sugar phosphate isomerase/epimerase [Paenibacillus sp. P22]CDN42534.1 Xylose isomerase domain protein TIM barrel [Paenibacillus sp. P22]
MKRASNGASTKPCMELHQAMWSMKLYGDNGKEWSLEQKFDEMANAGFTGIFGSLPEREDEALWRRLMQKHPFSFGLETFPSSGLQLKEALLKAQDYNVMYVNAQVKDSFTINREAVDLIKELYETAAHFNVPFFIETHRGRITQDLLRTTEYVRAVPEMALTIDLSHYILAGEMNSFELAEPYFAELLMRTGSIHGRVTNGQQIQIHLEEQAEHPIVEHFRRWWKAGMRNWLTQAQPGDVLPFVCEIGHHYSITPQFLPSSHSSEELSDRWQQSKLLKKWAEQLWMDLQKEE